MSNLHRIIWIDAQIRAERYPNCRAIADHFEISPRQASRDVEYLRYSLGAPIEYCSRANGYYYRGEAFALPASFLSPEEKDALDYLAFQYRSRQGGQAAQLAQLFARLAGEHSTGGREIPVFSPGLGEIKAYKTLNRAVQAGRKVEIEYINAAGIKSRRIFCPYIFFTKGDWGYAAGFCELRGEVRVFKLERIGTVHLLEEKFQVVPWFDPSAYMDGFDFREPYQAVLKAGADELLQAGLPAKPGDQGICTVQFSDSSRLLSALLGVGRFTVLAPRWLKQRLHSRLHTLLAENFSRGAGCDTICPTSGATMVPEYEGGEMTMQKKLNPSLGMTWTTYIGSVDGALRMAGYWDDEIYKLMGMTGMAFHFIVHKTACPSSVTVYDWGIEHFAMMDRIGVHTEQVLVFREPKLNTFKLLQEDAVAKVKASIDAGVPVVTWAPTGMLEFGLISGYNDEDKVFFVKDCMNSDPDPLLYTNLGVSEVPYLFVQIFKGRVDVDPEKIYRESLEFGVGEWKKESHVSADYASGRKAYENLLGTLDRGDFDEFGLAYNLSVYADSKACIARYLEFLAERSRDLKGLEEAGGLYRQVAENYQKITRLIPFTGPETQVFDRSAVPEVLALVRQCLDLEERAMAEIERVLA